MKNLINVAKELNDVMGLDPAIKTVAIKKEKLTELILQAADMIDWETDILSEETKKELAELGIDVPGQDPTVVIEDKKEVDLIALVDKATKLKDLKPLVEQYNEFKSLRKRLTGMFDPVELKEEMMVLINPNWVPEEETPLSTEKKEPAAASVPKKEKVPTPTNKPKVTKKQIVLDLIGTKTGATIEEIAQEIVDQKIDLDYEKNRVVVKLWLNKMGFDTKKAVIEKNPKFKK